MRERFYGECPELSDGVSRHKILCGLIYQMPNKFHKQTEGMVDISSKPVTKRRALASAEIYVGTRIFKHILNKESPKGDLFATARIAAVMAAKNTPNLIVMCHPIELDKVKVSFKLDSKKKSVLIKSEVVAFAKTGVEMEALCAASTAALTIYDMMKWAGKDMVIKEAKLLEKSGGKSGDYKRKD